MGHRVGITQDEMTRKAYWMGIYSSLKNWQIIGNHQTKSAAQKHEDDKVKSHDCDNYGGGDGPEIGEWKVYHFDY